MSKFRVFVLMLAVASMWGCSVKTVNRSKNAAASKKSSDLSVFANNYFWEHFHAGNYAKLDSILFYLMAAYVENPNHTETVAHLGFAHIWALSELDRRESDQPDPRVVDHATLSLKYFGEAYQLNPADMRSLGFLADLKMVVGNISEDPQNNKGRLFRWSQVDQGLERIQLFYSWICPQPLRP